jgi:hypothetical protein
MNRASQKYLRSTMVRKKEEKWGWVRWEFYTPFQNDGDEKIGQGGELLPYRYLSPSVLLNFLLARDGSGLMVRGRVRRIMVLGCGRQGSQ